MDVRIRIRKEDMADEVMAAMQGALSEALTEIAEDAASEARRLVNDQSVSKGFLEASIGTDTGDPITKTVFSGNDRVPYDVYVEFGTMPHWPPSAPIEKWVKDNLAVRATRRGREYRIKARPGEGFRPIRAKTSAEQQEVRRVAFLVARKIARKGIAPKPFMRPALALAEREGPSIIEEHMQEVGL